MPRRAWAPFDFDAHWAAFWAVWSSDEVQDVLAPWMDRWCVRVAGRVDAAWRRGDPLWHLSLDDYWRTHMLRLTNDRMDALYPGNAHAAYVKTMSARALPYARDPDDFYETVWRRAWEQEHDAVERANTPRDGTLESLVLVGGREFVLEAMALTAARMFPGERICVSRKYGSAREGRFITLPDRREVFDILDFYYMTRLGGEKRYPRGFRQLARLVHLGGVHDDFDFFIFV